MVIQLGKQFLPAFGSGVLLLAVLLVGCTSGQRVGTCPHAPGPIVGSIVFCAQNNLLAIGEEGGGPMQLTKVTTGSFAHKPAWSPDGQTLAYTLARPTQDPALNWLPLGIICGIDRETGKGRLLAHGAGPLESFDEAAWTDDSQALLLTRHQPQLDADRQFRCDKLSVIR